jgi:hypothetical protein
MKMMPALLALLVASTAHAETMTGQFLFATTLKR